MSLLYSSGSSLSKDDKERAATDLLSRTAHDTNFYVLLIGSILLALGAIFADSIPVLIASMLIAPLAYPVLALGLGLVARSRHLILRSLIMLAVACLIAIAIAVIITVLFEAELTADRYVSFSENYYVAALVAVVAGIIAAYGLVKPKVATAITGVAVAVSLLPPLVAQAVGYASGNSSLGNEALTIFVLNVAGILVGSIGVFLVFGMGKALKQLKQKGKV